MTPDSSAEIARFIMHADCGNDPRELVFGILRCFQRARGDEIKRGIQIALELHEAEISGHRRGDEHGKI